ncbi:unnamed protein product, partial [Allacma fusca]
VNKRDTQ